MKNKLIKALAVMMIMLTIATSLPLEKNMLTVFSAVTASAASTKKTSSSKSSTKKKIKLKKSTVNVTIGYTYTQKLLDKKGKAISYKKIKWKTANKKIATISKKGVITAKKVGKVKMTATYNKKKYTFTVNVKKPTLNYKKKTLTKGKTFTLSLKNTSGKKISTKKIVFTSNNEKVATVSSKGVVKAKKSGTATISAIYKNIKYNCKVTVKKTQTASKPEATTKPSTKPEATTKPSVKPETTTRPSVVVPTTQPVTQPTTQPVTQPTTQPTTQTPVTQPSTQPTTQTPVTQPVTQPTTQAPTTKPTTQPTTQAPQEKEVDLASSLSKPYYVMDENSLYVQDFYYYIGDAMKAENKILYERHASAYAYATDFVTLLTSKFNFRLADEYYKTYWHNYLNQSEFFSFALEYIGKQSIPADVDMQFKSGKCHIVIWGSNVMTDGFWDGSFMVQYSSGLDVIDLGYRTDKTEEKDRIQKPGGPSFYEGLRKKGNTYSTVDKRLSTTLGNACVIKNFETFYCTAEATPLPYMNYETVKLDISGSDGAEQIKFSFPCDGLRSGDIYFYRDIAEKVNSSGKYDFEPEMNDGFVNFSYFDGGSWMKPAVEADDIMDLTVRVLYCDDKTAVLYIFVESGTFCKGNDIEILCAYDRTGENSGELPPDDGNTGAEPFVELDKMNVTLSETQTVQLTADVYPKGSKITWKSSNDSIATVSPYGLVTAEKSGTAEIVASIYQNNKYYKSTCRLTVNAVYPKAEIEETAVVMTEGSSLKLTTNIAPDFVPIVWKSSDENVVYANTDGTLQARGKGTASVYVSLDFRGKTYTDYVDVCVDPYETTLAGELDRKAYKHEKGKIYIQDPYEYFGRKYNPSVYYKDCAMLACTLPYEEYEKYAKLLESEKFGFEIVDTTPEEYGPDPVFALNYKGETEIVPEATKIIDGKEKFHITVYDLGTLFTVNCSKNIEFMDFGYRADGTSPVVPSGTSTGAALKKEGEMYSTSDGRLSAKLGETVVLRNGEKIENSTKAEVREYNDYLYLNVGYRDEKNQQRRLGISYHLDEDNTGAMTLADLSDKSAIGCDSFIYDWRFMYSKGGSWFKNTFTATNFDDFTLRVMYQDEYRMVIYGYFDTKDFDNDAVIEFFSVVDLKNP